MSSYRCSSFSMVFTSEISDFKQYSSESCDSYGSDLQLDSLQFATLISLFLRS